jgi:hypothetical protein
LNVAEPERISALVAEGWDLLSRGDADAAALVFGRVTLVDPEHPEARRGLEAARTATTEAHRRLEERLEEARRAADAGDKTRAREVLEHLIAQEGGAGERVGALLDRLDSRGGRVGGSPPPVAVGEDAPRESAQGRWSRRVFAAACASVFAFLGMAVASTWDGFLARLVRAPSAEETELRAVVPVGVPASGDTALAEARRRLEAGDAAGALAALDGVSPEQPAYPLARQLRRQAEQAAGREVTAPSRAPTRTTSRP